MNREMGELKREEPPVRNQADQFS